jgi:hypothetical protein
MELSLYRYLNWITDICLWNPSKKELSVVAIWCLLTNWDKMSNLNKRTFHRCFLPSFGSFGHAVSEEKIFRNRSIPLTNMATTGDSCFWLADFKDSSPLKSLGQMIWNLVGSIYGRSSIKSTHFVPIPLTNMATTGDSCFWLVYF